MNPELHREESYISELTIDYSEKAQKLITKIF